MISPLAQARDLFTVARAHKREEARQRRLARERMEELRLFCLTHGIRIEEVKTEAGHGHGQEREAHT